MEGLTTTTTIIIAEQSFALMIDGKLYHPTTLNRLRTTETGGSLDSAKLRMKSDRSIEGIAILTAKAWEQTIWR